ncbi:MAG: hypothetical protein KatS3mg111_0467 [Pirellulaceae bacterium]|nr:MAG: hypothetical protein KatS3mg111_0467 [Pirellulaceae bacterium]
MSMQSALPSSLDERPVRFGLPAGAYRARVTVGPVVGAWLVAASLLSAAVASPIEPDAQDDEQPVVRVKAPIVYYAETLRATVELGDLPVAKRCTAIVDLVNTTDEVIEVRRAETSCGCIEVVVPKQDLPPGESLKLSLQVDVPSRAKDITQVQVLTLWGVGKKGVTVALRFNIAGLLCFKHDTFITRSDRGASQVVFAVPVLMSPPGKWSEIRASTRLRESTPPSFNVVASPIVDRSDVAIECKVTSTSGLKESFVFDLEIENPASGAIDSIACVVEVEQPVEIAPRVLRLVLIDSEEQTSGDSGERIYRASGLMRISEQFATTSARFDPERVVEIEPIISCTAEHGSVTCRARRIGQGIYRLAFEVRIPEARGATLPKKPSTVNVNVDLGKHQFRIPLGTNFTSSLIKGQNDD